MSWPKAVQLPSLKEFQALLPSHRVLGVERRAKYLLLPLAAPRGQSDPRRTLIIHLGMTGHLLVVPASAPPDRFAHNVFSLDKGLELRFRDPRKMGKLWLLDDAIQFTSRLGLEPLSEGFTETALAEVLHGRKTALKALFLDQTVIAGIGNIYADEAFFEAGIHPLRPAASLTAREIKRLHRAVPLVLEAAVEREMADYDGPNERAMFLRVPRFGENVCRNCGTPIQRVRVQSRYTYFCPHCQPALPAEDGKKPASRNVGGPIPSHRRKPVSRRSR